jgi:hypothetical protein
MLVMLARSEGSKRCRVGLGEIAQPVRVAAPGAAVSPPISMPLPALLGRERTLARLDAALSRAQQ